MSICFVTRKWPPAIGGMENYCLRLTEEISKQHKVCVIALPGNKDGTVPQVLQLITFGINACVKLVRGTGSEIVHCGDMSIWPLALIARLRNSRVRLAISAHGTDVSYPNRGGFLGNLYGSYLKFGATLLPDMRVIANSRATAQCVSSFGFSKISVVPLATDPVDTKNVGFRPRKSLLFAGRLIKCKGLKWFVENVLPDLSDHIDLKVAGVAWDDGELRAAQASRVDYLGPLAKADLIEQYGNALAVIMPNIELDSGEFEGFGLVACEAAVAGGVVLASSQGGLHDSVLESKTGFLLPTGVAEAWVAKINEVASWDVNQRKAYICRSRKIASEHFSWDRVARDTVAQY